MTNIFDLFKQIDVAPERAIEIDWREETDWFDLDRMRKIIFATQNIEKALSIKEAIAGAWYAEINRHDWEGDIYSVPYSLTDAGKYFKLPTRPKFDPLPEEYSHQPIGQTIESVLDNYISALQRTLCVKKIIKQRQGKQLLVKYKAMKNADIQEQKVIQEENKRLQERLEKQQEINRTLEDRCDALTAEIKKYKLLQEEKPKEKIFREAGPQKNADRESADVINIRKFLESIIEYAENFPSNQNDKADVIKGMLMAKGFNGQIPNEALTSEMRARIANLGRKETPMPAMFNVTGNEEVNIGAK